MPQSSKTLFCCLVFIGAALSLLSQNHDLAWTQPFGSPNFDMGMDVAVDDAGNSYYTGLFSDTVDFDPGPGLELRMSNGQADVFVLKLDSLGELMWVRTFGSAAFDRGNDIVLDDFGNVYSLGSFNDSIDLDPGTGIDNHVLNPNTGNYIQKLDTNGNFIWARSYAGSMTIPGMDLKVDPQGSIYATNMFYQTVDLDPGVGVDNHTAVGGVDIYVLKLDSAGDHVWAQSFGSPSNDWVHQLELDAGGNLYVTGHFHDSMDVDPGVNTHMLYSNGETDAFVQKLDTNGNLLWAESLGGPHSDAGYGVDLDADGNVYATGTFNIYTTQNQVPADIDVDPGVGVHLLTPLGTQSVYVQKLDSNHDFVWGKAYGSFQGFGPRPMAFDVDQEGNIYSGGAFDGIMDSDPGQDSAILVSNGSEDCYIQKLNSDGEFQWSRSFGEAQQDRLHGICLASDQSLYTTGFFQGIVNFDQGYDTLIHTGAGIPDAFAQRFNICRPDTVIDTVVACNFYTWRDSNTYSVSMDSVFYAPGCDTVFQLDLSIITTTYVVNACDSFTWIDGITYTQSTDTATWMIPAVNNCDSIATLDLTIFHSDSSMEVISACDSFFWAATDSTYTLSGLYMATFTNGNGCDSTASLDLTVLPSDSTFTNMTACDSFAWSGTGITYTASGTYVTTLVNAHGCDSVVTLDLTVFNSDSTTESIATCDAFTWPASGVTYMSSGMHTVTLFNGNGCDSVVTLDLTIHASDSTSTFIDTCNQYYWPATQQTYTTSGTHIVTLTNQAGCDSIATLELTIFPSDTTSESVSTCNSYLWPASGVTYASSGSYTVTLTNGNGCDSVATLNLTIFPSDTTLDSTAACGSYTWPANDLTYTTSGIYSTTLTNGNGCDSVVNLLLQIDTMPNNGVSVAYNHLTATQSGANYQWLNCDSSYTPISGANAQDLWVSFEGNYAVAVQLGACVDTSNCENVVLIGISERNTKEVKIYPVPVTDFITLDFGDLQDVSFRVYNQMGQLVDERLHQQGVVTYPFRGPAGVYYYTLEYQAKDAGDQATIKMHGSFQLLY